MRQVPGRRAWPLMELPPDGTSQTYQPAACRLRACVNSLRGLGGEPAGPILGGCCAVRVRSIVMQARDAAGRLAGVAALCATPLAAGQAPAVPQWRPARGRDSHIVFTGARAHANRERACPPGRSVRYAAVIRRRGS